MSVVQSAGGREINAGGTGPASGAPHYCCAPGYAILFTKRRLNGSVTRTQTIGMELVIFFNSATTGVLAAAAVEATAAVGATSAASWAVVILAALPTRSARDSLRDYLARAGISLLGVSNTDDTFSPAFPGALKARARNQAKKPGMACQLGYPACIASTITASPG
jgi:hypothetical protein